MRRKKTEARDEEAEDQTPSPAAEYFAELGRGLNDALYPTDRRGITPAEVAYRRAQRGASAEFRTLSSNSKLSPIDWEDLGPGKMKRPHPRAPFCCSTFASIETTCPESCAFKDAGCMADAGLTRITSKRLNSAARGLTELQVIAEEAGEIDRSFGGERVPQDGARGGRDLRLHVGGDVQTVGPARVLAGAAARWRSRGGGSVWTFTHSWREVPREAWGVVSVLASVEQPADLALALARGYAPAIVLPQLPADGRRVTLGSNGHQVPVIPCPGETRDVTCVECRLCLDRPLAAMGVGIAFGVHGRDAEEASKSLVQLRPVVKRRR